MRLLAVERMGKPEDDGSDGADWGEGGDGGE